MSGIKDVRGVEAKAGDIVVVGVTRGSSGGWLSVRKIVSVDQTENFVMMVNWKPQYTGGSKHYKATAPYRYRASSDFLILPKKYKDALELTD